MQENRPIHGILLGDNTTWQNSEDEIVRYIEVVNKNLLVLMILDSAL